MHRTSRYMHHLFNHARTMMRGIRMLWGAPVHVAAQEYLFRKEHRDMAEWIGALEKLVRAIVTLMALGLKLPALKHTPNSPTGTPREGPRPRILCLYWMDKPTSWPVRFQMLPRASFGSRCIYARKPPASRFVKTRALAFRLEAISRVLTNPRERAWRHARTMARLKAANARRNEPRDLRALLIPRPSDRNFRARSHLEPAFGMTLEKLEPRLDLFLEAT